MKAIVYTQHGLPISDPFSLQDMDLEMPTPGPRDLLVKNHAVSVNPVDTKLRNGVAADQPRVLGWDASGVVKAVGSDVSMFKPGDEVFYAGAIDRPGSYSEYSVVDERIVGRKPKILNWAESAAMPLTSITAWELLFDRLAIEEGKGGCKTLLVIGAAGGVGSIIVQLAKQLTKVKIIGTASRDETKSWVLKNGAHYVIDHTKPLAEQLQDIGIPEVDYVVSLTHTDSYMNQLVDVIAPQGHLALIDDPEVLDVVPLKRKSISLHWELMFTRSLYNTKDMIQQHALLNRVSTLVDYGMLKTTVAEHFGVINAENMRRAHALIESGKSRGKVVLEGFE